MKKEVIGKLLNKLRLIRQRATFEGWQPTGLRTSEQTVNDILAQLLLLLERLDEAIGALCWANAAWPAMTLVGWHETYMIVGCEQ